MIYKDFKGEKLSTLGLGCMRFPVIENDNSAIDMKKTEEMVAFALSKGINYFDTAWGYHGGESERVMGEILSKYPRESFKLASKFPGYDISTFEKKEEIFEKQLEKCRVDYFDFYLFHNVYEKNIDCYFDKKYGLYDYLIEQKKKGRIKHLGFSTHGSLETMERFIEAYGSELEFCQIQLNWLDWEYQNAKEKVELLNRYNMPIWVMEPIRGGSLAAPADKYLKKLNECTPDMSPVEWAFRFIQGIDGVAVTLSGMSNMEQLRDNVRIFETSKPLSEEQKGVLNEMAKVITANPASRCTSCRYCTEYCKQKLDIPYLISLYNDIKEGKDRSAELSSLPEDKKPTACIGCKSCQRVCPQRIGIAKLFEEFGKTL